MQQNQYAQEDEFDGEQTARRYCKVHADTWQQQCDAEERHRHGNHNAAVAEQLSQCARPSRCGDRLLTIDQRQQRQHTGQYQHESDDLDKPRRYIVADVVEQCRCCDGL